MSQSFTRNTPSSIIFPINISGVQNIGMDYNAGVLSVVSASGASFSSSPGKVQLQSKANTGKNLTVTLQNQYRIRDDANATSDLAGWYPGMNSNDDWNQDKPFFVYVIAHDTPTSDPAIGISLNPCRTKAPTSGAINVSGGIVSQDQDSMFLMDIDTGGGFSAPTKGNYDGNPCLCIGSFRMQVTTPASNDWTVQALSTNDGVGNFQEGTDFTYPTGVQGSAAGSYYQATTGTPPVFTNNQVFYRIDRRGMIYYIFETQNTSNTPSGAGQAQPSCPYQAAPYLGSSSGQSFILEFTRSTGARVACFTPFLSPNNFLGNSGGTGMTLSDAIGTVTNATFNNAAISLQGNLTYRAFNSE